LDGKIRVFDMRDIVTVPRRILVAAVSTTTGCALAPKRQADFRAVRAAGLSSRPTIADFVSRWQLFKTADGVTALDNNTTGNNNIAVGSTVGFNLTTGDFNIDIGITRLLARLSRSASAT
jgi:hypothetical protein